MNQKFKKQNKTMKNLGREGAGQGGSGAGSGGGPPNIWHRRQICTCLE